MAKFKHDVLLSFDFGLKTIGLAVGQTLTETATPLPTLAAKDGIPNWDTIKTLIQQWRAQALVVGLPYNMDGSEQHTTFAARKFGNRLKEKFQLPVYFVDERLTTKEAKSLYFEQAKNSRCDIDSYAAKLILESWFRSSAQ